MSPGCVCFLIFLEWGLERALLSGWRGDWPCPCPGSPAVWVLLVGGASQGAGDQGTERGV